MGHNNRVKISRGDLAQKPSPIAFLKVLFICYRTFAAGKNGQILCPTAQLWASVLYKEVFGCAYASQIHSRSRHNGGFSRADLVSKHYVVSRSYSRNGVKLMGRNLKRIKTGDRYVASVIFPDLNIVETVIIYLFNSFDTFRTF